MWAFVPCVPCYCRLKAEAAVPSTEVKRTTNAHTCLWHTVQNSKELQPLVEEWVEHQIPARRFAEVTDLQAAIVFMASPVRPASDGQLKTGSGFPRHLCFLQYQAAARLSQCPLAFGAVQRTSVVFCLMAGQFSPDS